MAEGRGQATNPPSQKLRELSIMLLAPSQRLRKPSKSAPVPYHWLREPSKTPLTASRTLRKGAGTFPGHLESRMRDAESFPRPSEN